MNRPRQVIPKLFLVLAFAPACGSPQTNESKAGESASQASLEIGPGKTETGRWHRVPKNAPSLSPQQRDVLSRIQALPYAQGSQAAPSIHGVSVFQQKKVQPGFNLFNSGHGPESFLIDLEGRVLHRWSYPIERLWPQEEGPHQSSYWRRVSWLPGGDILAIFEGIGLIRLDKDSQLKWSYKGPVHHQAVLDSDGSIVTLTRKSRTLPRINPNAPILEDYVVRLSPEGKLLSEISLLNAIEGSSFKNLLEHMKREGEIFHTNSIQILDGRLAHQASWLQRGNLLLSILFLDTICVLDPRKRTVVWALRGDRQPFFKWQHDPRMLPGGTLLLFDNWGRFGKSKIIEFDPFTLGVAWQYPSNADSDFFTATCGTSQRLANYNTLVTESEKGRAFEITPEGEIVWEYFNPYRAGKNGELIATLFELKRVSEAFYDWK